MISIFRPRTLALFLGDLLFFCLALYISLYARAFEAVSREAFLAHLYPFSLLFVAWVLVYFIAGLYESRSIILARRALSATLLVAQTVNMVIAALFFFLVPLFGIAPKTLLVIYLAVSFLLVLYWRAVLFPLLGLQKTEDAILVGSGPEISDLARTMNLAHRAPVRIGRVIPAETPGLSGAILEAIEGTGARVIVADFADARVSEAFPQVYNLITRGVRFVDALPVYEELFGRIPLSVLNERWLARNISRYSQTYYDAFKRLFDIAVAVPALCLSLIFYPFIMLAIKLEDGGEAVISMPRVGEGGRVFNFYKFRSMTGNDHGRYGGGGASKLEVTRVGRFIRASRLDELPQLWNLLRGDLSLIGPRPELPALVKLYEEEIPYYGVRHLIKPGISGWAQLYHHADPHHKAAVEDTRDKLSYDLYYLKHRSLLLDAVIAMKTVRRLLLKGNA
jgi:lipopolysaccharide/colanic/teichoic acid biosynthesis glycosyltransferase